MPPLRRWFVILIGASFAVVSIGCEGPRAPKTEQAAYRGELTARQTQVFGKHIGELPDQGLIEREGESFRWGNYAGTPLLVSAIYTNCPMKKMCPMVTSKIGDVQQLLLTERGVKPDEFRVILLTFDPERDTPSMLREYAESRGLSLENTTVVTGDGATIDELMEAIEVGAKEESDGTYTHNLRTYIVSPSGAFRFGFRKATWRPKDVASRLESVLK